MTEESILGAELLKLPDIDLEDYKWHKYWFDGKSWIFSEEPKFGYQKKRRYGERLTKNVRLEFDSKWQDDL